jgi:hypothetical protein
MIGPLGKSEGRFHIHPAVLLPNRIFCEVPCKP